ncbi:MAG: ATP-binding protein [Chloroflexota bacterium]
MSFLPSYASGWLVLCLYLSVILFLFLQDSETRSPLSTLERNWFIGLSIGTIISTAVFTTLLPIPIPNAIVQFSIFTAVPIILAAAVLPRNYAVVIGLLTGTVFSILVTNGLYDIFHFGIATWVISWLFNQPYKGRIYDGLRTPTTAGAIGMAVTAVLLGISIFFNEISFTIEGQGPLFALDEATFVLSQLFWVRLLEGLIGGVIVWFIIQWLPEIQPSRGKLAPPTETSLRHRLLGDLSVFSALLILLVLTVAYNFSVAISRRLVVNQMANIAQLVSEDIPPFVNFLKDTTTALEGENLLVAGTLEEQSAEIEDIYKSVGIFSRLFLVDEAQTMRISYPENELALNLSTSEQAALNRIFSTNQTGTETVTNEDGDLLSFILPVSNTINGETVALVGRVEQIEINRLIAGVTGPAGNSSAFIVDEDDMIIAHVNPNFLENSWSENNGRILTSTSLGTNSGARQVTLLDENQRQLVYFLEEPEHPWTVVVTTPYAVALNLAMGTGAPILLVLLFVTGAYRIYVNQQTKRLTGSIEEISNASTMVAQNRNWMPSPELTVRQDEFGALSHNFELMQKSVRQRISDLSLLLAVSEKVSLNLQIDDGMPVLLRGILRGTSAVGARAVIINPAGGNPLSYGEGPMAHQMTVLDRLLMSRLKFEKELFMGSPAQIAKELGLDNTFEIPIHAILAVSLHTHERFQGVMWLAYPDTHTPDASERNFINTLSSQAALVAYNALLFATADSGRRRLYTVLASTREPVIVTDPTAHILIINPAFEALFGLKMADVRNHRVQSVIESEPLRLALTKEGEHYQNVEIETKDGRIFYASASIIMDQQGQTFGRVAVLHDITQLKEIDELKSDFVQTVSHDLKNPLTFMRGFVDMLPAAGELNDKQEYYLTKINSGIDQMTQLVTDLLDLGRIEAGVDINQETIYLTPLLTDIKDEYWQHAHMAGSRLKLVLDTEISPVRGDLSLLRQAITNLVGNSIKYASVSDEILLSASQSNGHVIISVKDQGPGIPEKDQIRLFEKFYRVKQPGTEKIKGSGLGLAIVKSIAERHGGRAGCYSQAGSGATFFISLPTVKKAEEIPAPQIEQV